MHCLMHYCIRCGTACDCWVFDQSHGDVCDECSDCAFLRLVLLGIIEMEVKSILYAEEREEDR